MTIIVIKTTIKSTPQTLFDLSRSVDFHKYSVANTKEEAIAGRTSGLCEPGITITWEATHFGYISGFLL